MQPCRINILYCVYMMRTLSTNNERQLTPLVTPPPSLNALHAASPATSQNPPVSKSNKSSIRPTLRSTNSSRCSTNIIRANRRKNYRASTRHFQHITQMNLTQRCLTRNQDESSPLFSVTSAVREIRSSQNPLGGRKGLHATGNIDHPVCLERAA